MAEFGLPTTPIVQRGTGACRDVLCADLETFLAANPGWTTPIVLYREALAARGFQLLEDGREVPAPWLGEPNDEQWIDAATGLQLRIYRHPKSGHLCGYVREAHGLHGCVGIAWDRIDVHGGITGSMSGGWTGFDCGQVGDVCPYLDYNAPDAVYRDWAYAQVECRKLAAAVAHQRRWWYRLGCWLLDL